MKRIIAIMLVVMVTMAMATGTADAKKKHKKHRKHKFNVVKVVEVETHIHCPYCGDGTSTDCPYVCGGVHMTDDEIAEFEWLESHYQDEDGNWIER